MDPKSRTSRRISNKKLKDQLERMVDDLMPDARVILRKASAHTQTDFIKREVTVLHTVFETIKKSATGQQAHLIMLGPDAVQRVLADTSADRIDHIDITTLDQIDRIQEWCRIFAPDLIPKIRRVDVEDESLSEDLVLFMSVQVSWIKLMGFWNSTLSSRAGGISLSKRPQP
jgi:Ribonuclease G/E